MTKLLIDLELEFGRFPIDYCYGEDDFTYTGIEAIDNNKLIQDLNIKLFYIYNDYYEFDTHDVACWFNEEQFHKDIPMLKQLTRELIDELNRVNDGTYFLEDKITVFLELEEQYPNIDNATDDELKKIKESLRMDIPYYKHQSIYTPTSKKLNINNLVLHNLTTYCGQYQLLKVESPQSRIYVSYLANYSDRNDYNKAPNTAISFYENDIEFDGKNGIYNIIKSGNEKQIENFLKRFENNYLFIAPDYTIIGDYSLANNLSNINKSREVLIWLSLMGKVVIPNVSYTTESSFDYVLDGLEDCRIIALNLLRCINRKDEKELFKKFLVKVRERLPMLMEIIVYTTSTNDKEIRKLFEIFDDDDVHIVIPDNKLRNRNKVKNKKIN